MENIQKDIPYSLDFLCKFLLCSPADCLCEFSEYCNTFSSDNLRAVDLDYIVGVCRGASDLIRQLSAENSRLNSRLSQLCHESE